MLDLSIYLSNSKNLNNENIKLIHLGYFSIYTSRNFDFKTFYDMKKYSLKILENNQIANTIPCRAFNSYLILKKDFENNNIISNSQFKQDILNCNLYNDKSKSWLIFNIL